MNAAPIAISGVFHFAGFIGTSAGTLRCRPTANIYRKQPQKAPFFTDVVEADSADGDATHTRIVSE
jgi:hypothetical protein